MNTTSNAFSKVTIEIEYDRPYFIFPDLSSPEGNPREYFKMAGHALFKAGFNREAIEAQQLLFTPYETHFNTLIRFLNFQDSTVTNEDDEYVYVKIKKNQSSVTQPRSFDTQDINALKNMVSSGYDFSETNCYARHHLHYLKDTQTIEYLLKENQIHQWFNIFELDRFNSTLLHGNRDLNSFSLILESMYNQCPHSASTFLYGTNCFDKNAFGEALKECDIIFSSKSMPSDDVLKSFSNFIRVMGLVDPQKKNELIEALSIVEEKNKDLRGKNLKNTVLQSILKESFDNFPTAKKPHQKI